MRILVLLSVATLSLFLGSCNQQDEELRFCYAYLEGFAVDSISGIHLANMPINSKFCDDSGHFVIALDPPTCEYYDVHDQSVFIRGQLDRYFTRFWFDRGLLTEGDTLVMNVPFVRGSVVKLIFLDTSGVSLQCFDHYNYTLDRNVGVMLPSLADTTRYIYTYPNRPTMIRWYTISHSITSGSVSVPLDEDSTPENFTMYGDTIVTVALDDTVELHCFY